MGARPSGHGGQGLEGYEKGGAGLAATEREGVSTGWGQAEPGSRLPGWGWRGQNVPAGS